MSYTDDFNNTPPETIIEQAKTLFLNKETRAVARELLEKGVLAHPNHAELNYTLGHHLLLRGSKFNKESENFLKRAVALDPEHLRACMALGKLYTLTKDFSKAESWYAQAFKIEQNDPYTLVSMGHMFQEQGEYFWPMARGCFNRAREIAPDDKKASSRLAEIEEKSGKTYTPNDWAITKNWLSLLATQKPEQGSFTPPDINS